MSRTLLRSLFSFDPRPTSEVEDEMRAEFDAHLAMLEDELTHQGLDPAAARTQALARFGNPARLSREGKAIKLGDRIMLQRINLALLITLASVVVWIWARNNTLQRESLAALQQVSASLASLEKQRSPLTTSSPVPAPNTDEFIYLSGLVARPGPYTYHPRSTLRRLLFAAGGLKDDAKSITIDHKAAPVKTERFRVAEIMNAGSDEIPLDQGDQVSISAEDVPANEASQSGPRSPIDEEQLSKLAAQDAMLASLRYDRNDLRALIEIQLRPGGEPASNIRANQLRLRLIEQWMERRMQELPMKPQEPHTPSNMPDSAK